MKFRAPSRAASSLTLGMAVLVATTIFAQQFSTPKTDDQKTASMVVKLIERFHISDERIDDAASAKLIDAFVEDLDPQKLYFLSSDIQYFDKFRNQLDDQLKSGNVEFVYRLFDIYLKRLDERIALAHKLIDAEHDFTTEDTMVIDPDALSWSNTSAELDERWRKRIKYDLLTLKVDGTSLKDGRERLHKRYRNIRKTIAQTEDFEKLEMYLSAVAHTFDPHSSYMSPETLEDFQIQMRLSLEGIGAALRSEDGYTIVAQVVPGGAADKDGRLQLGDKIIGVAQEGDPQDEFVDLVEMKLNKVVRYIRGDKGTKVRLQVKTEQDNEIRVYELTRQKIELKSSEVKGEIIETRGRIGEADAKIGVIQIPSFYRDFSGAQQGIKDFKSTSRDVIKVLRDFRRQGGVDAIVVDLRNNGGGALSEAIEVSGLFIDRGPVVQVKEQDGGVRKHDDDDAQIYSTEPLVVLCNRLSASASEIFAGAIKDYQRGIIVGGESTHGKGTVQNVMPVSMQRLQIPLFNDQDRGALKLTISQFYRVNGDSTQSEGVHSDIVLPSMLDHMELGESSLDNALAFDRIDPAKYNPVGKTTPEMISTLRQRSQQRVAADPDFQKTNEAIADYLERKQRKTISLNEVKFREDRKNKDEAAAEEEEEADENDGDGLDGPVFPDDHFNNEVLRITLDYLGLLGGLKTVQR